MTVYLVNPLPAALGHYEASLREMLPGQVLLAAPSIERSSGPLLRRIVRQLRARRVPRSAERVLVLWPAFGRWDGLTWALAARRHPVWLVVHDPEPLRAQRGDGAGAGVAEMLARRAGVRVIAHSEPAAAVLRSRGWEPVVLPHPVGSRQVRPQPIDDGPVLVLGQYKPARSLAALTELAADRAFDGCRLVVGRGWPQVGGWVVEDAFVEESRFELLLAGARCVVIPYDRFFQSGVAVRALELGVPVVARRHPFLVSLLGADWPGFAVEGAWSAAVHRAAQVSATEVGERAAAARARAVDAWSGAWAAIPGVPVGSRASMSTPKAPTPT